MSGLTPDPVPSPAPVPHPADAAGPDVSLPFGSAEDQVPAALREPPPGAGRKSWQALALGGGILAALAAGVWALIAFTPADEWGTPVTVGLMTVHHAPSVSKARAERLARLLRDEGVGVIRKAEARVSVAGGKFIVDLFADQSPEAEAPGHIAELEVTRKRIANEVVKDMPVVLRLCDLIDRKGMVEFGRRPPPKPWKVLED